MKNITTLDYILNIYLGPFGLLQLESILAQKIGIEMIGRIWGPIFTHFGSIYECCILAHL